MEYFEKFINEVQTLEIKIREYYQREDGSIIREFTPKDNPNIDFRIVQCIDLSHYSDTDESNYEADLRELQQLAITDLLNQTQEIIKRQLNRIVLLENRFSRFWELYKDLHKDFREQKFETEDIIMKIERLFIVPKYKKGIISESFIRHLHHAIMFKHGMLSGFGEQVKKVLQIDEKEIQHKPKIAKIKDDKNFSHKEIAIAYFVMEILITPENADGILKKHSQYKSVDKLLQNRVSTVSVLTKLTENKTADTKHFNTLKNAKRLISGMKNKVAVTAITRIISTFEANYVAKHN